MKIRLSKRKTKVSASPLEAKALVGVEEEAELDQDPLLEFNRSSSKSSQKVFRAKKYKQLPLEPVEEVNKQVLVRLLSLQEAQSNRGVVDQREVLNWLLRKRIYLLKNRKSQSPSNKT